MFFSCFRFLRTLNLNALIRWLGTFLDLFSAFYLLRFYHRPQALSRDKTDSYGSLAKFLGLAYRESELPPTGGTPSDMISVSVEDSYTIFTCRFAIKWRGWGANIHSNLIFTTYFLIIGWPSIKKRDKLMEVATSSTSVDFGNIIPWIIRIVDILPILKGWGLTRKSDKEFSTVDIRKSKVL